MSTSLSEVNKINLINIQPTTKYVDKNGPSTNPEYYVKKVDLDKQLSNIPTNDTVVSISKNLITNALDNYYDKDHIDGQLSCKSNTNHTHTTINNDLTINSKRLNLYSTKAAYTYFTFGKNGKDRESAVLGFGDDNMGKYAFIRVNGGKQFSIFNDKATFPSEFTVTTLNGINPSTISLNTHNHDDKYASKEHTHSFNDLEDKPELALANHTHTEFNNDVAFKTNVSIYDKLNDICVPLASEHMCFLGDPYFPFVDSRGDCWIGDSLTFYLDGGQDKSLGFYSNSESSLSIYNNNNKKLIGFGEDKNRPGTETVDTYLEFNRSDSTT